MVNMKIKKCELCITIFIKLSVAYVRYLCHILIKVDYVICE